MDSNEIVPPYYRMSPFVSIIVVIVALVGWMIGMTTLYAYDHLDYVRSHWNTEKCKPTGLLVGGQDNLHECVKPILGEVVGKATAPLSYGALGLTTIFVDLTQALQQLRGMFDYLRVSLTNITREIFGRIVNLMIPLQTMMLTMRDIVARMYAVFATALYMGVATIMTMKKVLEMILTFVIIILISLAALIILMWIFPFSWAMAATFTAIFVSISIPLVMFAAAVGKVTDLGIPKIPSKPHVCFDKYTKFRLARKYEGEDHDEADPLVVPIYKLKLGDVLQDGSVVVSKMKLEKGDAEMYYLNGVLVSGTHLVKHKMTWIPVSMHPQAIELPVYRRKTIYCINTSSGRIHLENNEFTDWNEMLDVDFIYIKKHSKVELSNGLLVPIQDVRLGDVLQNGRRVTGCVKTYFLKGNLVRPKGKMKYYHLYTK
jgi:hypothetical protein